MAKEDSMTDLRYQIVLSPDDNGTLLVTCPDLPEWAPLQKSCPKATLARPVNDHYEFWQGISW